VNPKTPASTRAKVAGASAAKAAEPEVQTSPEDRHPEIEDEHSEAEYAQEVEVETQREREGSATTSATLVDASPLMQEPEPHEILEKAAVVHDEPEEHVEEHEELTPEASEATEIVEPATAVHVPDVVSVPRDDLDDIVNMLESKPLISAQLTTPSATVKPGQLDIDEIPDIDEY